MILLATLLSFGWPADKTQWLPPASPVPTGTVALRMNKCCGSMRPSFQGGEQVYAIKPDGRKLRGYVICTREFTHRVVAETKDAVKTAGDNNPNSDRWTPKSEIVWVILYAERK